MKKFLKRFVALRMTRNHTKRINSVFDLEKKHFNQEQADFSDSIYFAGITDDSFSFVMRMAFRHGKRNENWLKISIPGEGVWGFENLNLPVGEGFEQGELKCTCIEPGEVWNIQYHGPVYQGKKHYQIHLDFNWHSLVPVADFDNIGTSYEQVAFQIAKEKWNVRFFKKLKEIYKVHYEQAGNITGSVVWKRKKTDVQMKGFRDHSYGKRCWKDWGRHVWLIGMLNDGRFFNVSIVEYDFVKNLKAGFLWNRKNYVTFEKLPSFGDLKLLEPLPKTLSFTIKETAGSKPVTIRVKMHTFFSFTMNGVYHIRQAQAQFEYGTVKGTGIAEMGINIKKYNVSI